MHYLPGSTWSLSPNPRQSTTTVVLFMAHRAGPSFLSSGWQGIKFLPVCHHWPYALVVYLSFRRQRYATDDFKVLVECTPAHTNSTPDFFSLTLCISTNGFYMYPHLQQICYHRQTKVGLPAHLLLGTRVILRRKEQLCLIQTGPL